MKVGWILYSKYASSSRVGGTNLIQSLNKYTNLENELIGYKIEEMEDSQIDQYDTIVFQKQCSKGNQELARKIKARGKKVVFTMCDYFKNIKKDLGIMANIADEVVSAGQITAEFIRELTTKPVSFIADPLEVPKTTYKQSYSSKDQTELVGLTSHHFDLIKTLQNLDDSYRITFMGRDNVKTVQIGVQGNSEEETTYQEICEYNNIELVPAEQFRNVRTKVWGLDTIHNNLIKGDIGIIPINREIHSRNYKTNNRLITMMALGLPVVATKTGNYIYDVVQGKNAFLIDNVKDWKPTFEYLRENPEEREQIGRKAREDVISKYSFETITKQYEKILRNRD